MAEDYVSFENFVPIKGYEEYLISKEGKIYSPKTHKLLGIRDRGGYLAFTVCVNNKRKDLFLHRALAVTFIPNPENLPFINHKDGNKHNNVLNNLEWCTGSQNVQHAYDTGLRKCKKVGQYKNGVLIKEYINCMEASKAMKLNYASIWYVLNGRNKNAGGYEWKYIK